MLQEPQPTLSILDPTSLLGKEITELIARTFPAARRKLFHTSGEAEHLIADVAREAAIVQPLGDPEELVGSDVVVITARPPVDIAAALGRWLRDNPGVVLVDATQPGIMGTEATPVLASPRPGTGARWFQLADPVLCAPVTFLAALSPWEPEMLHATVLAPASGFGEEGIQELAEQAVARLSGRTPRSPAHLPMVLAFDSGPVSPERRSNLTWQLASLCPGIETHLHVVQTGHFHGHAALVLVRCPEAPEERELLSRIRDAAGLRLPRRNEQVCMTGVVGEDEVVCAELESSGGWISAWLAADGLRLGGAQAVVDLLSAVRAS